MACVRAARGTRARQGLTGYAMSILGPLIPFFAKISKDLLYKYNKPPDHPSEQEYYLANTTRPPLPPSTGVVISRIFRFLGAKLIGG